MKQANAHADYALALPKDRWRGGSLGELFTVLRREALADRGSWKYRVLRGGAQVALRIENERLRLRIARSDSPKNGDPRGFERECQIFRTEFNCLDWESEWDSKARGIALFFLSPAPKQETLELGSAATPNSALAEGR